MRWRISPPDSHLISYGIAGVPHGTNGSIYGELGIPTVVFGPGNIAQAHTVDEWVDIKQLQASAEIYYAFAKCLAE